MGRPRKKYTLEVGDKIKKWEIISEPTIKNGTQHLSVKCDCGYILSMPIHRLIDKKLYTECSTCSRLRRNKLKKNNGCKSVGDISGTLFLSFKYSAKARKIKFDITNKYIWNVFITQNGKCALSGLQINLSREVINGHPCFSKYTASLDRIDNNIGYIEGNIQWVHKDINYLRNRYSIEYLTNICSNIYLKNELKIESKSNFVNNYDDTFLIHKSFFNYLKTSAKRRKICLNVDINYIHQLFLLQNGKCNISGIDITPPNITNSKSRIDFSKFTASLDRIDSNIGYIEGNIQWVHRDVNIMKYTFTNEEFIEMCCKIYKKQQHIN